MKNFKEFTQESSGLTVMQKQFLDKWASAHSDKVGIGFTISKDMSAEDYAELEGMNDFETLYKSVEDYMTAKMQFGVGDV